MANEKEKYSYADYQGWDEGERLELIDGEIFVMSPAPSRKHQQILRELSTAFQGVFTKGDTISVDTLSGLNLDLNQIFI